MHDAGTEHRIRFETSLIAYRNRGIDAIYGNTKSYITVRRFPRNFNRRQLSVAFFYFLRL